MRGKAQPHDLEAKIIDLDSPFQICCQIKDPGYLIAEQTKARGSRRITLSLVLQKDYGKLEVPTRTPPLDLYLYRKFRVIVLSIYERGFTKYP